MILAQKVKKSGASVLSFLKAKNLEVGDNNSKGAMTKLQPSEPTVIGSTYQVGLTIKVFFHFRFDQKNRSPSY